MSLILNRINDNLKKVLSKYPEGKGTPWDSWANRFLLGIDRTAKFAQQNLDRTDKIRQEKINAANSENPMDTEWFRASHSRSYITLAALSWSKSQSAVSETHKKELLAECEEQINNVLRMLED